MATGTPLAINPRNEPRSAGVIAPTASRSTLPRTKASYSAFEDGLGTLEHAVALPPVDDEYLHRAYAREGEADHAHAVHCIHRQVDDGHLVVAHLLHHRPGEPDGVAEEGDPYRVDQRRHRAADRRRQQLVEKVDVDVPVGAHRSRHRDEDRADEEIARDLLGPRGRVVQRIA